MPLADAGGGGTAIALPFRLVKLPKGLTGQLDLLGELVWRTHPRCVGVLLLDRDSHAWSFAVPRQRAGMTASY